MDYEREPDSDMAGAPTESEIQPNGEGQTADSEGQTEGLGATDASQPGEPVPTSAEWPATDLVGSADAAADARADLGVPTGATEDASTMEAVAQEPLDVGDDSDAPIHLDDTPVIADAPHIAETPQAAAKMPQHVRGENVNLGQGGVQSIKASSVTLSQGGAGRVRADEMTVQQGGVGMARAGNLTLQSGSSAFAVVADEATVEEGANTFLVVSRSFSGDVRPTIDWRTGLAFGAGLGLVLSILRRLR